MGTYATSGAVAAPIRRDGLWLGIDRVQLPLPHRQRFAEPIAAYHPVRHPYDGNLMRRRRSWRRGFAGRLPFWKRQLESNVRRDRLVGRSLRARGWRVPRIGPHELSPRNQKRLLPRIDRTGIASASAREVGWQEYGEPRRPARNLSRLGGRGHVGSRVAESKMPGLIV